MDKYLEGRLKTLSDEEFQKTSWEFYVYMHSAVSNKAIHEWLEIAVAVCYKESIRRGIDPFPEEKGVEFTNPKTPKEISESVASNNDVLDDRLDVVQMSRHNPNHPDNNNYEPAVRLTREESGNTQGSDFDGTIKYFRDESGGIPESDHGGTIKRFQD